MNKIKKIICLVLAVLTIAACFALPGFAAKKTTKDSCPIEGQVSTGKSVYATTDIAYVKVSVKNISKKTVKNIVLTGTSSQLLTVGSCRKKVDSLKPGESASFTMKVVIARNQLGNAKRYVQNAVYYQHRLLKPTHFTSIDVSSGDSRYGKIDLEFGAWKARIYGIVYFNLSNTDYKGVSLKKGGETLVINESAKSNSNKSKSSSSKSSTNSTSFSSIYNETVDEYNKALNSAAREYNKAINDASKEVEKAVKQVDRVYNDTYNIYNSASKGDFVGTAKATANYINDLSKLAY